MIVAFDSQAFEDFKSWAVEDKKIFARIGELIKDISRDPFRGIGKPEPLRENLAGFWSRRIDESNRLIYAVENDELVIIACRYHYA